MSPSSCSDLEMVGVEIIDNQCSSDGCGAFLGKKSNLEDCTASDNRGVKFSTRPSSLVYAPASSTTTIQRFAASRNELTVVRVQDGVLSLSNASFSQNSPHKNNDEETKTSCIHSVNSSAEIDKCSFTANEGFNGSAVIAEKPNISVSGSFFWNNFGSLGGGCVYASKSSVTLENTKATNNSAKYDGGFMYAEKSNVTLENTKATSNSAVRYGGFMYARDSNVTLENIKAANNSAEYGGGFMFADNSTVTLENTNATNNSAKDDGGFMFAQYSNVKLENTNATNNSAGYGGGFMFAQYSNVKLENTKATNNSAKSDGGFMFAQYSNVTLENTKATSNSAGYGGGFMFAQYSNVTLENTKATSNSAESGGSVYGRNLALRIFHSHFYWSKAKLSGGFAALEKSSIFMSDSEIVHGRAKNGGAIWLKRSNMATRNLSILHCRADNDGGGVMSLVNSTFLCVGCTFENNSAERGNGGAVFFDSHPERTLALQIVKSRIENNVAELGGKTCEQREH